MDDIKKIISEMTLEEKAGMLSGRDFWRTKAVDRLGIPSIMVSDGPHGLRKQDDQADHLGLNESIEAVCFPTGCALASSFNQNLLKDLGEILGNECQAENVAVILGPAVNIKRSPLCGRNFEYYSEDPHLTSTLARSFIDGVQSKHVGTSIKHFLANNQEHRRMTSSSEVDERTLREIYLAAFEDAVREAKPWTVMCSYNKINGVYAAENKTYLTDVLRGEWGFDGFVVSDWGAVNDRIKDLKAGLELEMPDSSGKTDRLIVNAVREGRLDESLVDTAVFRILNIVDRFESNRDPYAVFNREADHKKAREMACECLVLLKNDSILPLDKESKVAFIGSFAETPRYQGGGSSHINPFRIESALEMAGNYSVEYAKGYDIEKDDYDHVLAAEAKQCAAGVECVVFFGGLPDSYESEGFDRTHLRLPAYQNRLIEELAEVNSNIVVVLHNGSPVEMPWIDKVKGVLEAYLAGQAVGGAVVQCLFGEVNPSGKLAESFPLKLEDNPSWLFYQGEKDIVEYREGIFVGYRYYDKKKMDVLFPFGYGLSYTEFKYSNLKIDKKSAKDIDEIAVSVDVTNIGSRIGKEVVQLYIAPVSSKIIRPVRELKAYRKAEISPGNTETFSFRLSGKDFSYFNTDIHDWYVESGDYQIQIGKSSRDIVLSEDIHLESTKTIPVIYTLDSTLGDMLEHPRGEEILGDTVKEFAKVFTGDSEDKDILGEASDVMFEEMINSMPLRNVVSFGGNLDFEDCKKILERINQC